MNKSIGKSPFQIVYGISPKEVVYLIKLLDLGERKSFDSSDFVDNIQCMSRRRKGCSKALEDRRRRNI